MTRQLGEYNEDYLARAREIYLESGMSTNDIADRSAELLGQVITRDRLRFYATQGGWPVERNKLRGKSPEKNDDIKAEVDTIRRIVFEQIKAESESGLLISPDNLEQKQAVIKFLDEQHIIYRDVSAKGIDPQLVNAYMSLLTRRKEIGIENIGASAKTPLQKGMEAAAKAIGEMQGSQLG